MNIIGLATRGYLDSGGVVQGVVGGPVPDIIRSEEEKPDVEGSKVVEEEGPQITGSVSSPQITGAAEEPEDLDPAPSIISSSSAVPIIRGK